MGYVEPPLFATTEINIAHTMCNDYPFKCEKCKNKEHCQVDLYAKILKEKGWKREKDVAFDILTTVWSYLEYCEGKQLDFDEFLIIKNVARNIHDFAKKYNIELGDYPEGE